MCLQEPQEAHKWLQADTEAGESTTHPCPFFMLF